MIIYGWNSKILKQAPFSNRECPQCGNKESQFDVIAHYFHLFWVPMFVYKKKAKITCTSCGYSLKKTEVEPEMMENVKALKAAVRNPFYLYIGSIILLIGISYVSFAAYQSSQQDLAYIEDPQVNDVYVLRDLEETSDYDHYAMKTVEIEGDSLFVLFNTFSYNYVISRLDKEDGFSDIMYSVHKDHLKELHNNGELKKVIRGYSEYTGFDRVIESAEMDSLMME